MAMKRIKDGAFEIRFQHPLIKALTNGKPLYIRHDLDDEEGADLHIKETEDSLKEGRVPAWIYQHCGKALGLHRLLDDYLAQNSVAKKDVEQLNILIDEFGHIRLNELDINFLNALTDHLANTKGLASSTISKYFGALRRAITWAEATNFYGISVHGVGFNFLHRQFIKRAGAKMSKARDTRPITQMDERVRNYLYGAKTIKRHGEEKCDQYWMHYRIAIETAMRSAEIFSLQAHNIDLESGEIFIGHSKTDKERTVPMTSDILPEVNAWIEKWGYSETDWLFEQVVQDILWLPQYVKRGSDQYEEWEKARLSDSNRLSSFWKAMFKRCGQSELRFHDLRHEATCRFYIKSTLTDIEIQKITGHASLVSLSRYASLRSADIKKKLW